MQHESLPRTESRENAFDDADVSCGASNVPSPIESSTRSYVLSPEVFHSRVDDIDFECTCV